MELIKKIEAELAETDIPTFIFQTDHFDELKGLVEKFPISILSINLDLLKEISSDLEDTLPQRIEYEIR